MSLLFSVCLPVCPTPTPTHTHSPVQQMHLIPKVKPGVHEDSLESIYIEYDIVYMHYIYPLYFGYKQD